MRNIIFLALSVLLLPLAVSAREPSAPAPAGNRSGMGIAAVVGGDAISSYELENRLRFIIVTAQMSNTPEVIAHIRPQVIRSLVDERLQMQEAAKYGITVSDEEVALAIAGIEQQRGMRPGAIFRLLEEHRIPRQTFMDQVRAQLAWTQLALRKIRPQIRISDDEITLAARKLLLVSQQQVKEMKIGIIQLPVDKPSQEAEVRKLADRLAGEIRGGASFEEVSRQFSSGASTSGGKVDAFWVRPEQLDSGIARSLQTVTAGMVTEPVRTAEGYTIIKVYEMRAVEEERAPEVAVAIKEILLKLKPGASAREAGALLQIGEEVARNPGACEEKGIASIDNLQDFDIEAHIHNSLMSELPPAIRMIAEELETGGISTPFASNDGIRLYMLCDKKESAGRIDRDRVVAMLFQQKMELEAQKYMRNLRREVFTDIR